MPCDYLMCIITWPQNEYRQVYCSDKVDFDNAHFDGIETDVLVKGEEDYNRQPSVVPHPMDQ